MHGLSIKIQQFVTNCIEFIGITPEAYIHKQNHFHITCDSAQDATISKKLFKLNFLYLRTHT
jgi:hypothetical protein